MSKRTRHGRKQDEAAWRSTEADMVFRLRDAGVRVPEPINFVDGVLVMELVVDAQGNPAPRLGELSFGASEASEVYQQLIREVVRMLCAGVIHGDLSDFNVLMGVDGPVLIDFPQAVDPAHNQNARKLLLRDVENLHLFLERFASDQPRQAYAEEMWALYQANRLEPETRLRGDYRAPEGKANTEEVLALIDDADREEQTRRDARGVGASVKAPKPMRAVIDFSQEAKPRSRAAEGVGEGRAARPGRPRSRAAEKPVSAKPPAAEGGVVRKKRRSRRRRKRSGEAGAEATARALRCETATAEKKTAASGGADRPSRRRRRRPRAAGSRGTS